MAAGSGHILSKRHHDATQRRGCLRLPLSLPPLLLPLLPGATASQLIISESERRGPVCCLQPTWQPGGPLLICPRASVSTSPIWTGIKGPNTNICAEISQRHYLQLFCQPVRRATLCLNNELIYSTMLCFPFPFGFRLTIMSVVSVCEEEKLRQKTMMARLIMRILCNLRGATCYV